MMHKAACFVAGEVPYTNPDARARKAFPPVALCAGIRRNPQALKLNSMLEKSKVRGSARRPGTHSERNGIGVATCGPFSAKLPAGLETFW